MEPPIQVTLAANAGVLLRVRNTSILIDALFADTSGCGPSPETRERLLCGLPPFDEVDYVLFTHLHQDHFSEDVTREFLFHRRVKGLMLPASERREKQSFFDFVKETGTPCLVLGEHTAKTVLRLSPDVRVTAFRTLHLDEKYHAVLHFCYLIACGGKRLLFTSDADYTRETFSFLGEEPLRAAFVNPLFFSDLQRRRFFHGTLPAEAIVVYHLPFPGENGEQLQQMFSRSLRVWPESGPPVIVLDRELQTIML